MRGASGGPLPPIVREEIRHRDGVGAAPATPKGQHRGGDRMVSLQTIPTQPFSVLCVRVAPFRKQPGGGAVRTFLAAVAVISILTMTTPAQADAGSGPSAYRALDIARSFGMVGFKEIQFFDGKWEIEGRDPRGKTMNMVIDALTGAVLRLDRDN